MKKKTTWLLTSLLLATAMVLSACGGDEDTDEATGEVTGDTGEVTVDSGPKYGGILTLLGSDPTDWDPAVSLQTEYAFPVFSRLLRTDWWRGPAGSGEWAFALPAAEPPIEYLIGDLAESWEMPDIQTIVYTLREDAMWQDKPGVMAARRVTAEDVKWNYDRYIAAPMHPLANTTDIDKVTITVIDDSTIQFSTTEEDLTEWLAYYGFGAGYSILPPEVEEQEEGANYWKNVTGSGPFALTDYISSSSISYRKNENWHIKDGEGRDLPYLDGFDVLIIPEVQTQMTALRSGQVDMLYGFSLLGWQDSEGLQETSPELLYLGQGSPSLALLQFDLRVPPFGPSDDPDARLVRRAAFMAIDFDGIVNDYYSGNAEVLYSTIPWKAYGLDELDPDNFPESSQELFSYNPEKAMELLTEAGYPEGIRTKLHQVGEETYLLIKEYWDAVGIQTEMNTMDYGAMAARQWGMTMTDVQLVYWNYALEGPWRFYTESIGNFAGINDSVIDQMWADLDEGVIETNEEQDAQRIELFRRVIDQAYEITMPQPQMYSFWQPWVKGYSGENAANMHSVREVPAFIWIDRENLSTQFSLEERLAAVAIIQADVAARQAEQQAIDDALQAEEDAAAAAAAALEPEVEVVSEILGTLEGVTELSVASQSFTDETTGISILFPANYAGITLLYEEELLNSGLGASAIPGIKIEEPMEEDFGALVTADGLAAAWATSYDWLAISNIQEMYVVVLSDGTTAVMAKTDQSLGGYPVMGWVMLIQKDGLAYRIRFIYDTWTSPTPTDDEMKEILLSVTFQ